MSNKEKKAEKVETVETVSTKTTSKGLGTLLASSENGEKLAGVLKMFGECELLRSDLKRQTVVNKVSKAGLKLRSKSNEELAEMEGVTEAMAVISKNFGTIKDAMQEKSVKGLEANEDGTLKDDIFTAELQGAYDTLLGFGKKDKVDSIPDTMTF